MSNRDKATGTVRNRYNRIAPLYDFMEGLPESRFSQWRKLLWSKVEGTRILEIGVGTGKNVPYYPAGVDITAIDLSEKMLARAKEKTGKRQLSVRLERMDVQDLRFEDDSFDTAVASFVFCSVPDPVHGLTEVRRVVKLGGKVVLLEHVLSANRILAGLMNFANPLVVRLMGENINRRTVENVVKGGLVVENVIDLSGIFKLIEARKLKLP